MLIIPRYFVIFAPGMKERGVILTTPTVEFAQGGAERFRKFPSLIGLAFSTVTAKNWGKKRKHQNQMPVTQLLPQGFRVSGDNIQLSVRLSHVMKVKKLSCTACNLKRQRKENTRENAEMEFFWKKNGIPAKENVDAV